MATWLLRNPSRLEILHLIQQHNRLNPAQSQQIPLHLSSDEDFKLRTLEKEQKLRKRNFNTVQRSAYSLRRCIEEVLSHNASSSTATYDREICVAATRDFLVKLEAESEAVESLKMAVERAKMLEDADIYKVLGGGKLPKSKSTIIVKVSRKKWGDRLKTMAEDQETFRRYNSSESGIETDATTSIFELPMPDLSNKNSVQHFQIRKSSQDMAEVFEQLKSVGMPLSMNKKPITSSLPAPKKIIKGILKARSSVEDLNQSSDTSPVVSSLEPAKGKLHPIRDHEEYGIERDRQMAKSLRKAHERGPELYSEVKRFK
jgi:hypothetical protein